MSKARRQLVLAFGLLSVLDSSVGLLRAEREPPKAEAQPEPRTAALAVPPVWMPAAPADGPPSYFDQALQSPPAGFAVPSVLGDASSFEPTVVEIPTEESIWSGRLELGFDGSQGNSRQTKLRGTAKLIRKTPEDKLSLSLRYTTSSTETDSGEIERTQNNGLFDWRFEEFYADTSWSFFIHGIVEYDEFTAFDYRVTADTGWAYNLVKNEDTEFQLRAGGGFSRKYGVPPGEDTGYTPETSYGFTFEHHFARRQKLVAKGDAYFDVRDFSDYRGIGEAAWEIFVDEAERLSLRFSVVDRYDSTPGEDKKRNDFTYAAELVWDF